MHHQNDLNLSTIVFHWPVDETYLMVNYTISLLHVNLWLFIWFHLWGNVVMTFVTDISHYLVLKWIECVHMIVKWHFYFFKLWPRFSLQIFYYICSGTPNVAMVWFLGVFLDIHSFKNMWFIRTGVDCCQHLFMLCLMIRFALDTYIC